MTRLARQAKQNYYSNMISESNDNRQLFKVVNELTNNKTANVLPDHTSSQELANRFACFFDEKIVKIRDKLQGNQSQATNVPGTPTPDPLPPVWDEFTPATPEEVKKIVMKSKPTTCQLDPAPSSLLKTIINALLPALTAIINLSFKESYIPDELKLALILPLIKKLGLDPEILKSFRPVSNLPYLSKLLERVAASRLVDHMVKNKLHELFQSSYKQYHSTETALLKIQSDILKALDNGSCVLLVMLDLSAAFDTIDHRVLLDRLQSDIGMGGNVLKWFSSYISGRKQAVLIENVRSTMWELLFGVPQGSVLGPLLFLIYMSPLGKVLQKLGVQYHFYADDSQIYVTFDVNAAKSAVKHVQEVVSTIKDWMQSNFLCLNEDKTEVLLIASKNNHAQLDIPTVNIGNCEIELAKQAKNIGFIFDSIMDCKAQIAQICKSGWFQLKRIGRIRPYLDKKSTEILVHAFITSRIDQNNCLLLGLPQVLLKRVQILQNSAARLIKKLPKRSHITDTLIELHWLPVIKRIEYKIILFVFKAMHDIAPAYIRDMIEVQSNSEHDLRSNGQNLLITKSWSTATYGPRNFINIAPILWNNLPDTLRHCEKLATFKRLLKTHLFREAYFD